MKIGIISAMQEEIQALHSFIKNEKITKKGKREYYDGVLFGQPIVLVFSRWGKVASATTTTQLINDFNVDEIIFTGVAGSVHDDINIGDIVIGKNLYQHDMDASPLLEKFEIPLLRKKFFETNKPKRAVLEQATKHFLLEINQYITKEQLLAYHIEKPKIFIEDIASGDLFISTKAQIETIKTDLPNVACVEMEGAAVAQVCYEYEIPFSIIRTISDKADDNAHIEFQKFAKDVASNYALGILKKYFELID
jgi:adenosylhomocysteine nucleosidase